MTGPSATLVEACGLLEDLLTGTTRRDILDALPIDESPAEALGRLRSQMRAHTLRRASGPVELRAVVHELDQRTREEGFRVLHNWDHKTHEFTEEIVPVLMLDYFERAEGGTPTGRVQLEILLDYYLLHLLALCAMRVFDHEAPDAMIDRVTELLGALQARGGSGHQFAENAETLIIYALSQFHPEEQAYDRLVEKVVTLSGEHQTRFALPSAAVLSAHLRWGFWLMYERDVLRMRDDNVGDYPWLLNSVVTLMREYARLHDAGTDGEERSQVVEGLLQGLAADPWAFGGTPPPALAAYSADYEELRSLIERLGEDLLVELEEHRPTKELYSPLSLHFNFPHNTLVATVAMALRDAEPQRVPLNALFRRPIEAAGAEPGAEAESPGVTQERFARALTAYSRASPDRLGYHGAMLVAYDPYSGMRSFSMTVDAIRKSLPSS